MTPNATDPGSDKRKKQLDTVRFQLNSQRPSDIRRGLDHIRQWLNEDLEDRDVYSLLLDIVEKNHEIREQVRDLLIEMTQKESKRAAEAMSLLPSSVDDLLADADDAFYAAEYERAIQLYRQVLTRDPDNARAKSHIAEARKESPSVSEVNPELPRDAIQYYRRARSYIAAKDFSTAMKMLGAAVESAQTRGMKYTEAEKLLISVQDSSMAEEFKQKIYELAMDKGQWKEAFNLCTNSLLPDMTDEGIKHEFDSIHKLLREELALQKQGWFKAFMPLGKLQKAYRHAKEILAPKDILLKYIGKQLLSIQIIRTVCVLAVAVVGFAVFSPWEFIPQTPPPTESPSLTPTTTVHPTSTATMFISETTVPSLPPSETAVPETPTPSSTETFTPVPTATPMGYGKITAYIFPVETPNGRRINHSLKPGQVVVLLEQKEDLRINWYRCQWDEGGTAYEGWVLAEYIQIVPGP
jgi:tetratricopeptide (TPR) repeat protein